MKTFYSRKKLIDKNKLLKKNFIFLRVLIFFNFSAKKKKNFA